MRVQSSGFRVQGSGFRVQSSGLRVQDSATASAKQEGSGFQGVEFGVKWFRGGLVPKAHRLVYHSTLGSRVIKKKKDV